MSNFSRRAFLGFIPGSVLMASCAQHIKPSSYSSVRSFTGVGPISGTTLESIALPASNQVYSRLREYPGLPVITRSELALSGPHNRQAIPLFSFVHICDTHLMDTESPLRSDFIEGVRPQELLTKHGSISMINRIRSLQRGPHMGGKLECVIATGDQTDNSEKIELDWFFRIFNGGTFIPKSGDPHRVEGIQNWGGTRSWQPDNPVKDNFKKQGFPYIPGFMSAVCEPVHSAGLNIPWYSVFGNHDSGALGDFLPPDSYNPILTGKYKLNTAQHVPAHHSETQLFHMLFGPLTEAITHPGSNAFKQLAKDYDIRTVTPDIRRESYDRKFYIRQHLAPENTGPGPVGHGFTEGALDSDKTWSSTTLGQSIKCILMDSCNHFGAGPNGSIGERQIQDMEKELQAVNSRYYDTAGKLVRHDVSDQLCIIFSHHTSRTMDNLTRDPAKPEEERFGGDYFVSFLQRFPNVIAWVNGHEHRNKITPHAGPTNNRSFWEINTASHIDFPHHSRIIEVADNRDGTLSIFTTLIESDAPVTPTSEELNFLNLASYYREIAANSGTPWSGERYFSRIGEPIDHNTELLLHNPLA